MNAVLGQPIPNSTKRLYLPAMSNSTTTLAILTMGGVLDERRSSRSALLATDKLESESVRKVISNIR